MAQPENLAQLAATIYDVVNDRNTHKVIKTIATHPFVDLSTSQRPAVQQMLLTTLATEHLGQNAEPGLTYNLTGQTDEYYRTHDPDGNYTRLAHIIVSVAQRTR